MYLKTIELLGFKTFAEKTGIEFSPEQRITAIIGPNGCGKSNLMDAIRWAMGEQSGKILRSSQGEEIIFSGSEAAKPVSLAEVSLFFENSDHYLPLDFSEVSVKRRIFRSGESDFFINKAGCRLKDIQRLFMDTGIGRNSYAIVNQGQIDAILNSKPEERRAIFEEVAGINKYRSQKNEALNKLAATEANLARVEDLFSELKNQTQPLKIQAEKAEKYQRLKDELKKIEVNLLATEFFKISGRQEKNEDIFKKTRQKLLEVDSSLAHLENQKAGLFQELSAFEDNLNSRRNELVEIRKELETTKAEITINEERRSYLDERLNQLNRELASLNKEKSETEPQLEKAKTREKSDIEILKKNEATTNLLEEALKELENKCREGNQKIEETRTQIIENERAISNNKNTLITRESNKKFIFEEIKHNLKLVGENQEKLRDLDSHYQQFEIGEGEILEKIGLIKKEIVELNQRLTSLKAQKTQFDSQILALRDEISRLTAKSSFLKNISAEGERSFPGLELSEITNLSQFSGKVQGVLKDLMTLPDNLNPIVNRILREKINFFVVDSMETVLQILEFCQKSGKTIKLGFFILSLIEKPENLNISRPGSPEFLSQFIKTDVQLRPLVEKLFGRILLLKNLAAAEELLKQNIFKNQPDLCGLATLEGEFISREGWVFFDREPATYTSETIYEDLKKSITEKKENLKQLVDQTSGLDLEVESWQKLAKEKEIAFKIEELKNGTIKQKKAELDKEKNSLIKETAFISQTVASLNGELAKTEKDNETSSEEIKALEAKKEQFKRDLSEFQGGLSATNEAKNLKNSELNELKISLARESARYSLLKEQAENLKLRMARLFQQIEEKVLEQKKSQAKLEDAQKNKKEFSEKLPLLLEKEKELAKLELGFEETRKKIQDNYKKIEPQIQKVREEKYLLENEISEIKVRLAEIEVALENIKERLQSEYEIDPATVKPEEIQIEDFNEAKTQAEKFRRELHRLEPVNLGAIDELKALEERLNFMANQKEDLVKAKENLTSLIRKLDVQAKRELLKSVNLVNDHFSRIFAKIFGGGEAHLVPLDAADILNSGIEIIVQLPGKRKQNLLLLSGGERALTSAALLFAMLEAKPAPFCALDEVDAPLDENNIDRFVELLKEYSKKSQILIITHSRRTIAAADVIYGVTMETPGISKVFSIKLNKVEEVLNQ